MDNVPSFPIAATRRSTLSLQVVNLADVIAILEAGAKIVGVVIEPHGFVWRLEKRTRAIPVTLHVAPLSKAIGNWSLGLDCWPSRNRHTEEGT